MFADRQATAMLPAADIERARTWYQEKLGLTPAEDMGDIGVVYHLKGVRAFLYKTAYAGTAENTALTFDCPDLVADMKALRAKGVTFIDYDLPGLKTVNGLAEFGELKNAWAKDSEGNILAFVQGM
ncbi:MAG TPA: VOC family protein [Devosia sp.]|jgi:catechol 2,3-dioxygenase-like lactoylglutathione lyase family enzyme